MSAQKRQQKLATHASGSTIPEAVAKEPEKDYVCPKKRAFLLTFNEDPVKNCNTCVAKFKTLKSCDYLIWCKEFNRAGNEHTHLYVHFTNAYAIPDKLRKLTKMHIDDAKGSPKQNIDYVKKEGPKWEYKKSYQKTEVMEEWGTQPTQGQLTISELREIKDSNDLPDWKQYHVWKEVQKEPKKTRVDDWGKKIEVYWIQGPSGIGKTETAKKILKEKGYEEFDEIKYDGKFWLNVVDGKGAAVYDDFRDSQLEASEFINFIDYNEHNLRIIGGSMRNKYNLIIITTVQLIDEIYQWSNEPMVQWIRRINVIDMYSDEKTNE